MASRAGGDARVGPAQRLGAGHERHALRLRVVDGRRSRRQSASNRHRNPRSAAACPPGGGGFVSGRCVGIARFALHDGSYAGASRRRQWRRRAVSRRVGAAVGTSSGNAALGRRRWPAGCRSPARRLGPAAPADALLRILVGVRHGQDCQRRASRYAASRQVLRPLPGAAGHPSARRAPRPAVG